MNEIEEKSKEVNKLSAEVRGITDLINSVQNIDVFTALCMLDGNVLNAFQTRLDASRGVIDPSKPLNTGLLLFNTGNEAVPIDKALVTVVCTHLKEVFLPALLAQRTADRNAAIQELNALING